MTLTTGELAKLRDTHPHIVIPYLSVHKPATVWSGTLTGTYTKGAVVLNVTTYTGSLGAIGDGMTIFIDQPGPVPLRKRRVRATNGIDEITIDENGLELAAGDAVWVEKNYELWSKFPRIVPGSTPDDVEFYKDYNNPFPGFPTVAKPVPIIRGRRCHFADSFPFAVELDGYESFGVAESATVTLWNWSCADAITITGATTATPTLIFLSAKPNGAWVTLDVEDSYGTHKKTHRLIFIHERTGANAPYTDFELSQLQGDWESGGWRATLKTNKSLSGLIDEGAHVILWHEAVFGNYTTDSDTDDYLGNQSEILIEGWITKEEPTYSEEGVLSTTIQINDIVQQLKERKMFSISLTNVLPATATKWYEYETLTVHRALCHLYEWHSTLIEIANFKIFQDNFVLLSAVDDFKAADLYSMGDQFSRNYSIFAHFVSTKFGDLYCEIEYNMLSDADRALVPSEMTMTDEDYAGNPVVRFVRNTNPRIWIVEVSGTYFDGTVTPLIATAPGSVPDAQGFREVKMERLAFEDANDHVVKAGRVYAVLSAEYERFTFNMAGNYTFMDLMPQRKYFADLDSTQTGRDAWSGNLIPRNISINFDQETGSVQQTVEFEPEAPTFTGVDVPVPETPPPPDPPDPVTHPTIPPLPTTGYGDGFGTVYVMLLDALWRTRNFSATPATWTNILSADAMDFVLDPWNPYSNGMLLATDGVYRSSDLTLVSPSFSKVLDVTTLAAVAGQAVIRMSVIKGSPNFQGYYCIGWMTAGTGTGMHVYVSYTYDHGATWSHSLITTTGGSYTYARNYNFVDVVPHALSSYPTLYAVTDNELHVSDDGGANWTTLISLTQSNFYNACDAMSVHCPYDDNALGNIVYTCIVDNRPSTFHRDIHIYDRGTGIATTLTLPNDSGGVISRWSVESYTNDRSKLYFFDGVAGADFFVSDDYGATYSNPAMDGVTYGGTSVYATGGFPTTAGQFYMITGGGVFVTVDRGDNWVNKSAGSGMNLIAGNAGRCVVVPLWLEE